MSRKRIAFGRISQETNAFSALPTTMLDFERLHYVVGDELMARCERGAAEAPGFVKNAELSGFVRGAREIVDDVELVPLISAWAVPGGPLTAPCFEQLTRSLVDALKEAGDVDGLMLSMHGAMGAHGSDDCEADIVEACRAVVGPGVPIAVSLDLHGHLDRRFVEAVDILTTYRTNPHRDHANTGRRAGRLLLRAVLGDIQPTSAWRSLPMLLGGGNTIDLLQPMRPIYRWMKQVETEPGVLYVSMFNAHLWNDAPGLGWATHVVTDNDPALAERIADELAQRLWDVRHHRMPEFPDPQTAIDRARKAWWQRRLGIVTMSDASDVVAAGAPGENTRLLRALLDDAPGLRSYVPIRDTEGVRKHWDEPIGSEFVFDVGGKLSPERDPALPVRGRITARHEVGAVAKMLAVDLGHVQLVVTEGSPIAMKPDFFTSVGLNPWKADVVVLKSFFPFRAYFLPHNRLTMYVKTEGVTDFDVGLSADFQRPVFPLDQVDDWRPLDRARRGVGLPG